MYHHMLSNILCDLFMKSPGKWQVKATEQKAFMIKFDTRIDSNKEEGYRGIDMLLYGPMNYVQVWVRDWSDVISIDDLQWDEEAQESCIKKGKDYIKTVGEWKLIGDHDSCWRDSISSFLWDNQKNILGFGGSNTYDVVPFTGELANEITQQYKKKR